MAAFIVVGSVVGIVLVVFILGAVGASRYKKAGPHQAFITTGRGGQRVVIGGGMFIWPVVQSLYVMDLQAQKVPVHREGIYSKNNVPITIDVTLVYKVKGDEGSVKLASQALMEMQQEFHKAGGKTAPTSEISEIVQSVAEGALRDIVGKMTPEEINADRESFQNKVLDTAAGHFDKIGIDLVSFVVNHIMDDKEYFQSLGAPAIAEAKRVAREQVATKNKAATVVEAEQARDYGIRQAETKAEVFNAEKDRDVKKAGYDALVAVERAKADQAGPQASAQAQQQVVEQETTLAERRAQKREKELMAEVLKPADAERQKKVIEAEGIKASTIVAADGHKQSKVIEAEGEKQSKILVADGDKQAITMTGEGEGAASKARKTGEAEGTRALMFAEADGTKAKLLAEAEGNKAKLLAEATGLQAKADAMKNFNDVTIQLEAYKSLIAVLPQIVEAAAKPIAGISDVKVIHFTGGKDGQDGDGSPVSKFLDIPPEVLAKTDESLRATVGVGLKEILEAVTGSGTGAIKRLIGTTPEAAPPEPKQTGQPRRGPAVT
jgi:flotillin